MILIIPYIAVTFLVVAAIHSINLIAILMIPFEVILAIQCLFLGSKDDGWYCFKFFTLIEICAALVGYLIGLIGGL